MNPRIYFLLSAILVFSLACMTVENFLFGEYDEDYATQVDYYYEEEDESPAQLAPRDPPPASASDSFFSSADCPNGDCVVACMVDLRSIVQAPSAANALRGNHSLEDDDSYVLVTYTVRGDELLYPEVNRDIPARYRNLQSDTAAHERIWRFFAALIPASQRTYLTEFVIYTDGKDEELAAVSLSVTDPSEWVLMVDISDAQNPQELTFTLIHEFGHLLTLNATQIPPNQALFDNPDDLDIYERESESCDNYFTYEGCANSRSYLNLFVLRFWDDIWDEWIEIDSEEDEDRYYELLDDFYYEYEDQFVTDYAATNPEEDIAESFSYFILDARPRGNSIAEQKIKFFYEFPELVRLREHVAINLCAQVE
jgi:hypothetical protein